MITAVLKLKKKTLQKTLKNPWEALIVEPSFDTVADRSLHSCTDTFVGFFDFLNRLSCRAAVTGC